MKKITSIAIALMMVISASAMQPAKAAKRAPQQTTADPIYVTLDANFCLVEDMEGKEVQGMVFPAGGLKLSIIKMKEDGSYITRFATYIANDDEKNNHLNADYSMGIDGLFSSAMVAKETGSSAIWLDYGYLQVSFIKSNGQGGDYDFFCQAADENGNIYMFAMQLPTMVIKGESQITLTDKAPLYEEEALAFNKSYSAYEIDDQYLADYGVLVLYGYDNGSQIALQFIVGKSADLGEVGIPVGTYSIDYSDAVGTVGASNGMMYGDITESYAMLHNGESFTNVWYIHSGSVVVANDNGNLKVTVDGTNFLGKSVKATIGGTTGIEEVKAAEVNGTAKAMDQNGQLMIIRNGVRYNAQGAVIRR